MNALPAEVILVLQILSIIGVLWFVPLVVIKALRGSAIPWSTFVYMAVSVTAALWFFDVLPFAQVS